MGGVTTVTFTPGGPTTQCVSYTILGDDVFEPVEQFFVTLSAGGQFVAVSPSLATVIIVDDDCMSPRTIYLDLLCNAYFPHSLFRDCVDQ